MAKIGFRRALALTAVAGTLGLLVPLSAPAAKSVPPAPRSAEMPELSGPGQFAVGTQVFEVAARDRKIGLRIWYPAIAKTMGQRVVYRHRLSLPGQQVVAIAESGRAIAHAQPASGTKFPLIVMSHGYGGWAEHMSQLGEALASRGYVVASIDHRHPLYDDLASFAASFGSVLLNRTPDQQLALRTILDGKLIDPRVAAQVDATAIGLIGFSMGGYGALITAGAPVDPGARAYALMPQVVRARLPAPDVGLTSRVKAVVAIAPWGAQPDAAVWGGEALGNLKVPLMLIDGDRDDIVDFTHGVKRIFDQATGSDRHLLVYREAAHNIAGNPVALPYDTAFPAIEFVADPVWRKDRIEAVNQHFITAFFDYRLKGDVSRTAYLNVPVAVASDGRWPSSFGQQWGGVFAGEKQPEYWRGFQRRWARGLEMHHKAAGE